MSKFKIGDRVKVRADCDEYPSARGTVVALLSVVSADGFAYEVDFETEEGVLFRERELSRAGDLGPKPLTLTGGKARFTVREGWTTREPRDRTGRRFYASGDHR